jgi:flavin-dependent dehydrogenase
VAAAERLDVAVAGGGPAGCATALMLRAHAPQLSVGVFEASDYGGLRIGECIPPPGRILLEHLGVWGVFEAAGHRPAYGTAAAWGESGLSHNDFIYTGQGRGWHLDRAHFDTMLAREAEAAGAETFRRVRVLGIDSDGAGWRLRLGSGQQIGARFVVDATGSAAAVARRMGASFVATDRMAGFGRLFEDRGPSDPRVLVEAFAQGWWYTAGLPGDTRIVVCMTDRAHGRRLGLQRPGPWFSLLETTSQIAPTVEGAQSFGPAVIRTIESRRLDPPAGSGWLAVGDAASVFDPLSSQGIVKALRSGIFAAYAISDLLLSRDDRGMHAYRRLIAQEFESYLRVRAGYYRAERRWPESEFWRRRATV